MVPAVRRELPRFDPTMPNGARIVDYFIGGKDNFAADRKVAMRALELAPELPMLTKEARKAQGRVVRHLVRSGIRQFIDIGCGLPTQGNVHEVAQAIAPDVRVAYVDIDPVVVAHAEALLVNDARTTVVQADARYVAEVLGHPGLTAVIDLDRPVGVLVWSMLNVITEDEVAAGILAGLRQAIAPGSYLAAAHAVSDLCPDVTAMLTRHFQKTKTVHGTPRLNVRTRADIEPYFDGLKLVEPGLVPLPAWRPDPGKPTVDPETFWVIGGVGYKE